MARLTVIEQGQKKTYNLTRDTTTIGRAPDSHVPIGDIRASRRHAVIQRFGDDYELRDEGSQNGTRVNGSFVDRKILKQGDVVEIGDVRIAFEAFDAGAITQKLPRVEELDQQTLVRERENLLRLQRVTMAINSTLEIDKLLGMIVDHAIELTEAERGFLILSGETDMKFEVARNFAKEQVAEPEFNISRTIAEKVFATGEPVLAVNAMEDGRFKEIQSISAIGLRSVLCLPFSSRGRVIGVLYIDNRLQKGVFSRVHLRMLEALAAQAALAIEHARLFAELGAKQKELIEANHRVEKLNAVLKDRVERQQLEIVEIRTELEGKQSELEHRFDYGSIIGRSPAMQAVFKRLDRVIPTEMPVLIEGESGTGKELVARAIHYMGPRKKKKFVSENCAALPETLLESELFGYMRGAFTGANKDKKGLFEEASGGTLFLDEVGEMSPEMQKKLLRAVQEKEIRPVGGKDTISVDTRIISASNRNLRKLVEEGKFREDLFYRLCVLTVELPPLRDRRDDIPLLLAHFFEAARKEGQRVPERIDPAVVDLLRHHDWPGNVRELENEVRRMIALSDKVVNLEVVSDTIRFSQPKPAGVPGPGGFVPLDDQVKDLEIREIRRALAMSAGNKTKASELLGISRFTLQRKLEKYNIDAPD